MAPFLEGHKAGQIILILILYVTMVAATLQLTEKRALFWSAVPLAFCSMVLLLASHIHPTPAFLFARSMALATFLILVSVSLFIYLGDTGLVIRGPLYVSSSLYFLLALSWAAVYSMLNILQPGSFSEGGVALKADVHWSTITYFSLTTLTTLGYGDILPVTPAARMISTLEASTGVLYVAITVSRLVSARQNSSSRKE
jgi:hypothetical protein